MAAPFRPALMLFVVPVPVSCLFVCACAVCCRLVRACLFCYLVLFLFCALVGAFRLVSFLFALVGVTLVGVVLFSACALPSKGFDCHQFKVLGLGPLTSSGLPSSGLPTSGLCASALVGAVLMCLSCVLVSACVYVY